MSKKTRNYFEENAIHAPTTEDIVLAGFESALSIHRGERPPAGLVVALEKMNVHNPLAAIGESRIDYDKLVTVFYRLEASFPQKRKWYNLGFLAGAIADVGESQQEPNSGSLVEASRAVPIRQDVADELVRRVVESAGRDLQNRNVALSHIREFLRLLARADTKRSRALHVIDSMLSNFHSVAQSLRKRRSGHQPLTIENEYDVQYLIHAMLRAHFQNVEVEEWVPSYAGSNSRIDFGLPEYGVIIEAKMTRDGLEQKAVVEQMIVDVERYSTSGKHDILIFFVYDPESRLHNPVAIVEDMARKHVRDPIVLVYVVPGL